MLDDNDDSSFQRTHSALGYGNNSKYTKDIIRCLSPANKTLMQSNKITNEIVTSPSAHFYKHLWSD